MFSILKQTASEFMNDRCTTLSAALAYYTIFSLPPLFYLLLTILTIGLSIGYDSDNAQDKAQQLIETHASQMLGNASASAEISKILDAEQKSGGKWWKTLISIGGVIIGATGVVAAIQDALNRVWSVKPDPDTSGIRDFLGKRLVSFGMILGLGFLLFVSLIVSAFLTILGDQVRSVIGMDSVVALATDYFIQALISFVIFSAIFKFMPDAKILWKDVAMGALMTTVLFLIGRAVLQWYLGQSDPGAQLGSAAASLVVILVWVYFSSMIFLFGAEATKVYAGRFGAGITPIKNAVQFQETIVR